MIRVFKFGGALLKDAAGIERMASIVDEFNCEPMVVVVSAIGKTTNALEKLLWMAYEKNDQLASDFFRLKSLHINLIRHGRGVCKARNPRCDDCVLNDICAWHRQQPSSGHPTQPLS